MAAGVLPHLGTKYGPCVAPCAHRDCQTTREMAAAPCTVCAEPIGYDRAFYRTGHDYAHARCLEAQIERERA